MFDENPTLIHIGPTKDSFVARGRHTAKAMETVRTRLGINTSGKVEGQVDTIPTHVVEERMTRFYNNGDGVRLIPSGNHEPEGWSQIGLRDAVVADTAQILKSNESLVFNNPRTIQEATDISFAGTKPNLVGVEVPFGITADGELVRGNLQGTEAIGARLLLDRNANVAEVTFIYPDHTTPEEMKDNERGNPRHYQLMAMASVIHNNLNIARRNGREPVQPKFNMENSGYKRDKFLNSKGSIATTLTNAVKSEFPQLVK